jgi:hypothetical protein
MIKRFRAAHAFYRQYWKTRPTRWGFFKYLLGVD